MKEVYMRRENRNFGNGKSDATFKNILYVSGSILGIAVIAFVITFVLYGKKLNEEAAQSKLSSEKIAGLVPNSEEDKVSEKFEEVTSSIGKTVEESQNEIQENTVSNTNTIEEQEMVANETTESATSNTQEENVVAQTNTNNVEEEPEQVEPPKEEPKKELVFGMPVEGEISKSFAKDSLVYSDTLQEWVVHLGVDIKAEKTTVVKASEAGTVKAIKNDPRYGLTVILEHEDGYSTVYSNLLTAEFVTEGETVEKGQTIGTVGNTATFEVAEESHLHFEMLKDGENVDPAMYLQ